MIFIDPVHLSMSFKKASIYIDMERSPGAIFKGITLHINIYSVILM